MKAPLSLFIGFRYLFSHREQKFISFVSLVSLMGIILGVFSMVLVLSVMNGFDRELKQRILKVIPHGYMIKSAESWDDWKNFASTIKALPEIIAVAPEIEGKGLVLFEGRSQAIQLTGILPEQEKQVSSVGDNLIVGSLDNLSQQKFGIVIGHVLAGNLGVNLGDKISVLLPKIIVTPVGVYPRKKNFTVVGIFRVGADLDSYLGLIHLDAAARLFQQKDKVTGESIVSTLRVKTKDLQRAETILYSALFDLKQKGLGEGVTVRSWADTHSSLFNAIKMEKKMITLLLLSVIIIAVFNIVSILTMMVAEKRKDIALLRVMGAGAQTILFIFIVQGMLVATVGVLIGGSLGSVVAIYLDDIMVGFSLLNNDSYFVYLPSQWLWGDVALVAFVSMVLSFLATLYPAWKSTKIKPIDVIL